MGVVGTALGEWTFETYLRKVAPGYAAHPGSLAVPLRSADRYHIEGGSDFSTNSRLFLERFRTGDAMILGEVLPESMEVQLRRYLKAWDLFMDHAIAGGARCSSISPPTRRSTTEQPTRTVINSARTARTGNVFPPTLALRAQDAKSHLPPPITTNPRATASSVRRSLVFCSNAGWCGPRWRGEGATIAPFLCVSTANPPRPIDERPWRTLSRAVSSPDLA
jgi:hypothetical protein